MAARLPYTTCSLYIDGADGMDVGDYIVTSGGSGYLVQSVRISPSRPKRKNLKCLRWPVAEIPAEARCFHLTWYRR